jgi:hypothetical protein
MRSKTEWSNPHVAISPEHCESKYVVVNAEFPIWSNLALYLIAFMSLSSDLGSMNG